MLHDIRLSIQNLRLYREMNCSYYCCLYQVRLNVNFSSSVWLYLFKYLLWNTNWKEVLKFMGRNLDPRPAPPPIDVTDTCKTAWSQTWQTHRRDGPMTKCLITKVTNTYDGHHIPWRTSTMAITDRDGQVPWPSQIVTDKYCGYHRPWQTCTQWS